MRVLLLSILVAACGVDSEPTGGTRTIVTEQPDAGVAYSTPANYRASCDQLVATDDTDCSIACSSWADFAAMATVGHCISATCPLKDGSTFTPGVCLAPKP